MSVKINLGCGEKYLEGYINCDLLPSIKAEKHFDLDTFPYPFESNTADEIFMDNVLEHLEDIPKVIGELHRILKTGGRLRIIVPYAKSDWAFQDPTHKHFFTEVTMNYFSDGFGYNYYTPYRFNILRAELVSDNITLKHKLRNLIPLRSVLRFFLFNLYDTVHFELEKL